MKWERLIPKRLRWWLEECRLRREHLEQMAKAQAKGNEVEIYRVEDEYH